MSLSENLFELKIEKSLEVLKDAFSRFKNVGVAWSTGKDSTTALFLAIKIKPTITVLFGDTTRHFPETYDFRDKMVEKWRLNMVNVLPESTYETMKGERERCCHELKIVALLKEMEKLQLDAIITGKRWQEYPDGSEIDYISEQRSPSEVSYVQVHPLLHWTEKDVWTFINQENIPYSPLYERGFSTIDCEGCTTPLQTEGSPYLTSAKERDREKVVERLRALGYW